MKAGAFSWQLGKLATLDSLPELADNEKRKSELRKLGMEYYCKGDVPINAMMMAAMENALCMAGIDPLEIDVVTFSMSRHDERRDIALIPGLLEQCGLRNARPVGISLGACANLSYAFEVCEGLIRIGKAKNILMVFSDFYENQNRVLRQNAALGSDGVGCCIISDKLTDAYHIKGTGHQFDSKMFGYLQVEDFVSFVRGYSDGVRAATQQALSVAGVSVSDLRRIVAPNFNQVILRNIAKICGVNRDVMVSDSSTMAGHCSAVDQLISLSHLLNNDCGLSGPLLITCPADFIWGACIMEMEVRS